MATLKLFRKRLTENVLVALGLVPGGVGCARVVREEGRPPVLEACGFASLEDLRELPDGVRTLVREHHLDTASCAWLLSPEDYSLLLVDAPDVPPEELRAAMRWRVKDLIDFHVDDAVLDVFDIPGHKGVGGNRKMYVVVTRSPLVRQRIDMLEGEGLALSVIDIQELALRNVAELLPEDVAGQALIHMTRDNGEILLTRQSTLHLARHFPFGTDRLVSGMDTPGALDPLVIEVQRSLDYYDSHYSDAPIGNLVLAPTPEPVPGMPTYLAEQLGLQARSLDLAGVIDTPRDLSREDQARCLPLVGAALREEERIL